MKRCKYCDKVFMVKQEVWRIKGDLEDFFCDADCFWKYKKDNTQLRSYTISLDDFEEKDEG